MSDVDVFKDLASTQRFRCFSPRDTQRCLNALGNMLFSVILRFPRWEGYIRSHNDHRPEERAECFRRLLRLLLLFVVNRSPYTTPGMVHFLVVRALC